MITNSFVIGFILANGAETVANEIDALNASAFVDVVVVVSDDPAIAAEADAREAVTFSYSAAEALDEPAVASLNAFFAADDTFISGGTDPWLVIVQGNQPDINGAHVNNALNALADATTADSIKWILPNAELGVVTYEGFMQSGRILTDNSLVFLTRPD